VTQRVALILTGIFLALYLCLFGWCAYEHSKFEDALEENRRLRKVGACIRAMQSAEYCEAIHSK
jgi:hypothetical protein